MKPNKIARDIVLKITTKKFFYGFAIMIGLAFCTAAVIICLTGLGADIKSVQQNIDMIYGIRSKLAYMPSVKRALDFFIFGAGITILFILITKLCWRIISKSVTYFEPSEKKVPKKELIEKALQLDQFTVESHGNWLDFSLNWKNCFAADMLKGSVIKSTEYYKKLIKLYDNYTFDELDYTCSKSRNIKLGSMKISFAASAFLGRTCAQIIEYNIGVDNNTGNAGLNKYVLNTSEFSDSIHKWLAENGYRQINVR